MVSRVYVYIPMCSNVEGNRENTGIPQAGSVIIGNLFYATVVSQDTDVRNHVKMDSIPHWQTKKQT